MTTDMREKIEAMLAGLEGVTPGPWDFDTELQADTSPRYNEFVLFSKDGLRLCGTENCDYRFAEIATEYDDDGSYSWNEPARILMEHLARCDPDTIRELCRLAKIGMESELRGRDRPAPREAYRAGLERAARLAESHFAMSDTALDLALESDAMDEIEAMHAGTAIATAIRALKEKQV